jgi:hypothetical protein
VRELINANRMFARSYLSIWARKIEKTKLDA